jgi:intracellular septation protein
VVERRVALLPLFSGVMALVFGTLGLVFHSDVFVKVKVTVINGALAAFMIGGVLTGRAPLKVIMGEAIHMPDAAWRTLTLRYGGYFAFAADGQRGGPQHPVDGTLGHLPLRADAAWRWCSRSARCPSS